MNMKYDKQTRVAENITINNQIFNIFHAFLYTSLRSATKNSLQYTPQSNLMFRETHYSLIYIGTRGLVGSDFETGFPKWEDFSVLN